LAVFYTSSILQGFTKRALNTAKRFLAGTYLTSLMAIRTLFKGIIEVSFFWATF